MKNIPIRKIGSHLGGVCESEALVGGFQVDSRCVGQGDLFFALGGAKVDGHQFLEQVKERGAVGAVVSKAYEGPDFGLVLLEVEDVLESLQELARLFYAEMKAQVIGVTGSLGKTTSKDFIATLLSGKFKVGKNLGSRNTKISLPLTILNMDGDEEVIVLEMGMTNPGDISALLRVAAPDIALLTKVSVSHIEAFPEGIAQIAREKAEIFNHQRVKTAVFYHGLHEFPEAIGKIRQPKISFSLEERSADYFLSFSEGKFLVDERGVRAYSFELPFYQSHILHNFLGAVAVARAMKMEWDEINRQVGKLELPKMRFEQFEREGIHFVNDAYNANPDSMRSALSSLPEPKEGGKRIAVLGTMVELGEMSEIAHREVGRFAQKYADHLLAMGNEATEICEGFLEVKKPAEHFQNHGDLAARLKELMSPGDVVLVKASRRMEFEKIFEILGR